MSNIESVTLGVNIRRSHVKFYLEDRGIDVTEEKVDRILFAIQTQEDEMGEDTDRRDDALEFGLTKLLEEEEEGDGED